MNPGTSIQFFGMSQEIPKEIEQLMRGRSYKEGCPVQLSDLRYVTVSHWDFEDKLRTGHLVVHAKIAQEIVDIFRDIFEAHFPIERMELVDHYNADDDLSMEANNSSCFNFRPNVTNPTVFSNHSYGIAIDINPRTNPYVKGDRVLPAGGRAFIDRTQDYKGGITASQTNAVYVAFTKRGYEWGGSWPDRQDYQHFSKVEFEKN
jgi:hypothetical protein